MSLTSDSGSRFDEASLPVPHIVPTQQPDSASILASQPNRVIADTARPSQDASKANAPAPAAPGASQLTPSSSIEDPQPGLAQPSSAAVSRTASEAHLASESGRPADVTSQTTLPPGEAAPPEPEDKANFSKATEDFVNLQSPHKPAKTVHLPPQAVQEERLREAEEDKRSRLASESERSGRRLSQAHVQGDIASSPSSTVGPYSAATPMPPQESPDTSPDSETLRVEIPRELRPSPGDQRAKEEHDRQLEAQKEIARRQALGDVNTPDDQLRWEEREAAAREVEEREAREAAQSAAARAEDNGRTGLPLKHPSNEGRTIDESEQQAVVEPPETSAPAVEDDDDNIIVTPRVRQPPKLDSVKTRRPSSTAAATQPSPAGPNATPSAADARSALKPDAITTSSHQTPASQPSRRRASSIEPLSPKTSRTGQGNAVFQTPRQPLRPSAQQSSPSQNFAALANLVSLKGAAEDPDRDYLEPLFRIQAHDSPNVDTHTLPELLRSSTKTVSTNDQFISIHERMDFRMLRRIYQLQNANKWSLRQMEKCHEPPPPVTHHDHMMAEMKWMCKDFRAERKMKKSVCAWLAQRCADFVAASKEERKRMQVKVRRSSPKAPANDKQDDIPDLESSAESAPEDDGMPRTPVLGAELPLRLVVDAELLDHAKQLQQSGSLQKALKDVPLWQPSETSVAKHDSMTKVSKFVEGKVLPTQKHPNRKRSRFDYEDDGEVAENHTSSKRLREERDLIPEDQDVALFHADNKHIRERLHANNAFRPPSEFMMPGTPFYEFRNGSQWVWEDDQKLRKLAKDYSFNWSLISDEMTLPSRFKSGMERRTPWECFERWVELETLPAEMKKTAYFKTWYQRLEHSQQAVDRRYNAQVAAMQQAQANNANGQPQHMPMRRRTMPTRVDKRKNTRYLWVVDAMRKLARKREGTAFKQAEAQRAAAQRKSSQQTENNQTRGPMPTPQEFSRKRYERDLQLAEMRRQHQLKMAEAQQRQAQMLRGQQQGVPNGAVAQQRPQTAQQAQGQMAAQHHPAMNGQVPPQARQPVPVPTRNGHLAVPQGNPQGVPQAQMRPGQGMSQADMQRMAQANNQGRPVQYAQQQYPGQNPSMVSPSQGAQNTSQQLASNQALLAAYQAQHHQQPPTPSQQMPQQGQHQSPPNAHLQTAQANGNHHASASPSMPPPPAPGNASGQLSSGHVPTVIAIKNQLRARYPNMSEAELTNFATEQLKHQSQSNSQVRQNAMNAAAGINPNASPAAANSVPAYSQNQAAYQNNASMTGNANGYPKLDANAQTQQQQANGVAPNPQNPAAYAQMMRQRQMQQMRMQQSPTGSHAQLSGSPNLAQASPNMGPASPAVQYPNANNMPMNAGVNNQGRPPSRSNTPQMQRLGSSGGVQGVNGMQSPGAPGSLQGSPRNMQASMAR